MNKIFRIEQGREAVIGHCNSCGHETKTFRGFVYDGDGAFAVYACTFTVAHPESGVAMAISMRGWGDGADKKAKECVALEWKVIDGGPGCRVVDASITLGKRGTVRAHAIARGCTAFRPCERSLCCF